MFLGAAASSLIVLPLKGQQPAHVRQNNSSIRRIGYLSDLPKKNFDWRDLCGEPLRELGWIEGQNFTVEERYTDLNSELLSVYAAELVRLKVELIFADGTPAAVAAKTATTSIPIVISAGDPVRTGLVASLAHPGGNVTGFSLESTELRLKRLQILHELLPNATRIGELISANPAFRIGRDEYEDAYRRLHIKPIFFELSSSSQLEDAVARVVREQGQALIVNADPLFTAHRVQLMTAALRHGLPTVVAIPDDVEAGALISYSASVEGIGSRIALYIDKILRGARPANLPIAQPTKFLLWINLKTAKALGLPIPQSLLLRADEVIQ